MKAKRSRESGNVIMIILIGVVLFAALSYTVNKGMRVAGDLGSSEKTSLRATEIITYGNSMFNAVQYLTANGCKDNALNFDNPVVTGYTNNVAPSDKSCNVFNPAGAGMTWRTISAASFDSSKSTSYEYGQWFISKNSLILGVGSSDTAPAGVDLILFLPYISKDVCTAIDKKLGYTGTIPLVTAAFDGAKYVGTYQASSYSVGTGTGSILKYSGCVNPTTRPFVTPADTTPFYVYYRVLLAR